jgi:hypothetical protein
MAPYGKSRRNWRILENGPAQVFFPSGKRVALKVLFFFVNSFPVGVLSRLSLTEWQGVAFKLLHCLDVAFKRQGWVATRPSPKGKSLRDSLLKATSRLGSRSDPNRVAKRLESEAKRKILRISAPSGPEGVKRTLFIASRLFGGQGRSLRDSLPRKSREATTSTPVSYKFPFGDSLTTL